ncbi:conserved unknown protein [Ectocarpus siliculosus]|uniref:Ubiquitin carboxyl-terminal hydrolase n=1 Tax=Ectocarpus siliculosus TaxID=2880 RepID=D7G4R1_ECTSI|nr:conserved unknown protein [Ectocarpus siliculosus]|eukprot:CBJ27154.1 conserved unknown protein [Ectocarpus siliculosus]
MNTGGTASRWTRVLSFLQHAIGPESIKGGNQAAATSVLDRDQGGSPPPSSGLSGEQLAVTGIKNLGNTCFLNAVLQSLASFHVFREYLEELYNCNQRERERERDSDKVLSTKPLENTVFTCELLQLMKDLEPQVPPAPPVTPIIPTKLRKLLRDRVDTFGKEDQQDAQELFQMVMRLVGEEAALCIKNRSTSSTSRTSAPGIRITGGFADLMDTASKEGVLKNLPENPLLGSLMYLRHCRGCQQKSGRLERFVDLSLTLPEARNPHVAGPGVPSPPVNLDKILEDFTREQLVEDVECPKCAMRSAMEAHETHDEESESEEEEEEEDSDDEEVVVPLQRVRADMRMLLATPPKTLCLHFPRRHQSPSGSEMKLKQRVIFPAHLNVARFCYAGGCHTDSIGVPTAFQMKSMLANSLPQLPQGHAVKTTPGSAGLPPEALLPTPPPPPSASSPPQAKALQSPQSLPGYKQALVGGSAQEASTAYSRKELNGLRSGSGGSGGGSSVSGSVEGGRDSNDVGSVSGNDGAMEYDLRAVIVHRGSADSGHYTAFRKVDSDKGEPVEEEVPAGSERVSEAPRGERKGGGGGANKEWVYISDEEVERVSEKRVLSSQAYMLFYRQGSR